MLPPTILVSPKYLSFVASLCFVTALELQLSDVKGLRRGLLFKVIFVASYQKYFSGLISKVLLCSCWRWREIYDLKKTRGSQQLDKQPAVAGKKPKFLCRGKSSKNWVGIVVAWCQVNPSTPPTANFFACLFVWTKSAILIYILCNGCSSGDQTCWRCSENATFRILPTFVVHWLQQIWGNCGGIKRSGASPQPTHWGVPNPLNADGRREGGGGAKDKNLCQLKFSCISKPSLAANHA